MTQSVDSHVVAMLEQLTDIRLRESNLKATGDALKAEIREALQGQEEWTLGRLRVTCKRPTRFSAELAATLLAPEILKSITETVDKVSEDLAKQKLTGDVFESCKEEFGNPKILITRIA